MNHNSIIGFGVGIPLSHLRVFLFFLYVCIRLRADTYRDSTTIPSITMPIIEITINNGIGNIISLIP